MISREVTGFVIHQVVSTLGVIMFSALCCYGNLELLKLIRFNVTTQTAASILLGVPGFPFQGAVGFFLGCGLARRLRAKSVVLVWILPLLWFCLGALSVAPTSTPAYLIGEGCMANRGCFYQVLFTLPLVASVFYTLGAIVSRRLLRSSRANHNSLTKNNYA
jgi:hypothetical protein